MNLFCSYDNISLLGFIFLNSYKLRTFMSRKLFCEVNPFFYTISVKKERMKRRLKNLSSHASFAKTRQQEPLPNIVKAHSSILVRRLHGVDIRLQENKVTNLRLACEKINGLVIYPGQTFSLWKTLGSTSARKGYKEGLVISSGKIGSGIGGGMCQMGNLIHWLVLHSPMRVTELHHHSDALFPDERRSVPFGTGTSVCYNYVDYRFINETDQPVQLLTWIDGESLYGELRSEHSFPNRYELVEEDHFFSREADGYFRNSKVYRLVFDRATGKQIAKELILNNHSRVMYDPDLIPKDQLRNEMT